MCLCSNSRRALSGTTDKILKNSSNKRKGSTDPLFLMRIKADTLALRISLWSCSAEVGILILTICPLVVLVNDVSEDPNNNAINKEAIRSDSSPL